MIASFLNDMPHYIETLQADLDRGDMAVAGSSAHALQGVAANLGTLALADAAKQIELACKEGQAIESVRPLHLVFMDLYPQTTGLLAAWEESE